MGVSGVGGFANVVGRVAFGADATNEASPTVLAKPVIDDRFQQAC